MQDACDDAGGSAEAAAPVRPAYGPKGARAAEVLVY
jgi:hypothetical protein